MEKALVTGGAGFIGSWVTDKLIEKGLDVIVMDNLSTGEIRNVNLKANIQGIDLRNAGLSKIFEKENPDYVFHLAAQIDLRKSLEHPTEDADINILGSLNLLENCVKYRIKKFIFSSTGGAIYGDGSKIPSSESEKETPASPYGIGKLTIEKYLDFFKKQHGLDYTALRYANVYGPRQSNRGEAGVVSVFTNKLLKSEPVTINGSGEQTRDYVFVGDVADANILALTLSGIFNVGTGIETNVNELYEMIAKKTGISIPAQRRDAIKGEQMQSCLDASKLKKEGWKPKYNLEKGLEETVRYFRKLNC